MSQPHFLEQPNGLSATATGSARGINARHWTAATDCKFIVGNELSAEIHPGKTRFISILIIYSYRIIAWFGSCPFRAFFRSGQQNRALPVAPHFDKLNDHGAYSMAYSTFEHSPTGCKQQPRVTPVELMRSIEPPRYKINSLQCRKHRRKLTWLLDFPVFCFEFVVAFFWYWFLNYRLNPAPQNDI